MYPENKDWVHLGVKVEVEQTERRQASRRDVGYELGGCTTSFSFNNETLG